MCLALALLELVISDGDASSPAGALPKCLQQPGLKPESGTQSVSPTWVTGIQVPEPSSAASWSVH